MQKTAVHLPPIQLVGIKCRTNNRNEQDPATAKIGLTAQKYFQDQLYEKIPHQKNRGVTYSVYTEYESDVDGDYTYFIGTQVNQGDLPTGCSMALIPAQAYTKFTTNAGKMPDVCINAWQEIWQMDQEALGGPREYKADFEVYDQRAHNPHTTILDIYIGVK